MNLNQQVRIGGIVYDYDDIELDYEYEVWCRENSKPKRKRSRPMGPEAQRMHELTEQALADDRAADDDESIKLGWRNDWLPLDEDTAQQFRVRDLMKISAAAAEFDRRCDTFERHNRITNALATLHRYGLSLADARRLMTLRDWQW